MSGLSPTGKRATTTTAAAATTMATAIPATHRWHGLDCSASKEIRSLALSTPLAKPQGLCWVPGLGLLICDARAGCVYLLHSLTPWIWRSSVILPRALLERGRATLKKAMEPTDQEQGRLHDALSILVKVPDEEFREILSWWQET
eukprot:TRINITY_DN4442_c0_g5_i1.p1 TRINITY_DN4442_c0_g5~~TRINITY_DN4442_c0_g5_i1.p1  ORF type:complete len:145 (-),score=23.86 TRINITY_DN4442_c0_g5_i1:63-497(-)